MLCLSFARRLRGMRTLLPLLCALALCGAARANDDDHERAREAVQRGELLSLERILALHPPRPGERLIEVDLERKGRRWEYELELLGEDGRVRELEIDGASGALLDEDEDD
jgi:uncharacterized membrane protein YkoI